jgi:lipopolysaccharide export system protein LptA
MVLRESQAKGRAVVIEGTVEAGDGTLYIRADSVTIM